MSSVYIYYGTTLHYKLCTPSQSAPVQKDFQLEYSQPLWDSSNAAEIIMLNCTAVVFHWLQYYLCIFFYNEWLI